MAPALVSPRLAEAIEETVAAAQQLAAAVKQHGAVFMPAFCHRFHPAIIELKKLIDGGVLGEPLLFRNCFGGYFPLFSLLPPFIRIDYVFADPEFKTLHASVGSPGGSDHSSVRADLLLWP